MAAFSRGLRSLVPRGEYTCLRCLQFSTTSAAQSGHNRWSKIKHDKAGVDAKKNTQRSMFSHEIALASKMFGADPTTNPKLATILATAKKAGYPKASMEAAVARGQGKSTTGAALENITMEFIMPPTVGMIMEVETDNKPRTLSDLRFAVKTKGGSHTPTSYLFQKKGRVAFESNDKVGVDDVLDDAIEAGAEDVEQDEDGGIVVWTEPNMTSAAAQALEKSHGLKLERSDILWDPNEDTKVPLEPGDDMTKLMELLDTLRDNPNVQGIYANVAQGKLPDDVWEELQEKLDA